MSQPAVGRRRPHRGGCYDCCQRHGTRVELWDRLCTSCRKLTRAFVCCGYDTVRVNPRVRVPRLASSGRWKQFLKRYPRFRFREELRHVARPGEGRAERAPEA